MKHKRVILADESEVVRLGMRAALARDAALRVIGEAADAASLMALVREERADLVVLEDGLPGADHLELVRRLQHQRPPLRMIMLAERATDALARDLMRAGAQGLVARRGPAGRLREAVAAVLAGRTWFSAKPAEAGHAAPPAPADPLTAREREVLRLIAEGRSSKEAGTLLGISAKTAETHRANLMRKLGAHSVSQLVRFAVRHRIVEP